MERRLRSIRKPIGHRLRKFDITGGLPNLTALVAELEDYWDVLLGRVDPPIDNGTITLMEVADAYFARSNEIASLILKAEREGSIPRTSKYTKFRTGELRHFIEVCKRAADLGSRRITARQLVLEAERTGRTQFEDDDQR